MCIFITAWSDVFKTADIIHGFDYTHLTKKKKIGSNFCAITRKKPNARNVFFFFRHYKFTILTFIMAAIDFHIQQKSRYSGEKS